MSRISFVSIISVLFTIVAFGCTDSGDSAETAYCKRICSKRFEECGRDWIARVEEWGSTCFNFEHQRRMCYESLTDDALKELKQTCTNECDASEEAQTEERQKLQPYQECFKDEHSIQCSDLLVSIEDATDALVECGTQCVIDTFCTDFMDVSSLSEICIDECYFEETYLEGLKDEYSDKCYKETERAARICKTDRIKEEKPAECVPGCYLEEIGDGDCDFDCFIAECTWDAGDCDRVGASYCSPSCFYERIGDGVCDSECNNLGCYYDGGDCGSSVLRPDECAPGCPYVWVGDGDCDLACDNADCVYDDGDCSSSMLLPDECAPGCPTEWIDDGVCDASCDHPACNYDGGDC